jgi:hypothetical protein
MIYCIGKGSDEANTSTEYKVTKKSISSFSFLSLLIKVIFTNPMSKVEIY